MRFLVYWIAACLRRCLGVQAPPSGTGLVLPANGEIQTWSSGGMGGPVVHEPSRSQTNSWKMWYYGCAASDQKNNSFPTCPGGIPYGSVGIATSEDGVHWHPSHKNPVLSPNPDAKAFDASRVAVGSIVPWSNGRLAMFYFGSNSSGAPAIGLCISKDGGYNWKRMPGHADGGAVLRPDRNVEGALAVTQPHVARLASGTLRMYYVALAVLDGTPHFKVWQAESLDGASWNNKQQLQLAPSLGSGVGSFGLLVQPTGKLIIFAGWELQAEHDAIGVLLGNLSNVSLTAPQNSGGKQALEPSGKIGNWDAYAVGCPYPLLHSGRLYVYFNGFEMPKGLTARSSIGLAIATNASSYFDLKRVELDQLIQI